MANKTNNLLNITIHQDQQRPKLYRISQKIVFFFIYVIPSLLVVSLVTLLIIGIYFQDLKLYQKRQESVQLTKLKHQHQQVLQKLYDLGEENKLLQKKLTQPIETGLSAVLALFQPVPGQTDLSSQGKAEIDQFRISRSANQLTVYFNIKNLTGGKEKISGYIIGIAKSASAIYVYPQTALTSPSIQLVFNKGESFGTHRFRPSQINFNVPNNINIKLYEIFIFSRTGDLITKKIYSPQQQETP